MCERNRRAEQSLRAAPPWFNTPHGGRAAAIRAILLSTMTAPDAARHAPRRHHDPLASRTVFVAPRRAERPIELESAGLGGGPLTACPFCAGHESLTPPDLLRTPADTAGPWQARFGPNR
jgi:hypothetical protein